MKKRQAISESSTTELPLTTPSGDEPVVENLIYVAKGKGILYTTEVPILKIRGNKPSEDVVYSLERHAIVTADERNDTFRLIIKFIIPEKTVSVMIYDVCNTFITFHIFSDHSSICFSTIVRS